MAWATDPLTGLALATTLADPVHARILAISARTVNAPGSAATRTSLVDTPGPVPSSATRYNGLTKDDLVGGLTPSSAVHLILTELDAAAASRTPVVVFNSEWFFRVLSTEAAREGIGYRLPADLVLVDPFIIDSHVNPARRAGNRTLPALAESWGVPQEHYGTSEQNVTAALRVAWRMGTRYPPIRDLEPAALHAAQGQWKREADDERASHFASRGRTDPSRPAYAA